MTEPAKNPFADDPAPERQPAPPLISGQEVYNVVTDTATGVNVRLWDNLIQAAAIALSLVLGAVIGGLMSGQDRVTGGVLGGFAGLVAGLLGSGIFLMVYRAARHARGKHD